MNTITIEDLIKLVSSYNPGEEERILEAYNYADALHSGQMRQSGEKYITHPLNVAYILASMHADRDTVIAGLLHDTLEDTKATKEEITELFGEDVALLVDGVTKLSKMNFSSKDEATNANARKIILGLTKDVRIIIVKLADRLHNMRTLEFKSKFKQQENALETLEIFAPLAYYLGAYRIKHELEDLALKYLRPDDYRRVSDIMLGVKDDSEAVLLSMLNSISRILDDASIPNEIKIRTKNVYGVYKRLSEGSKLDEIHDLLALKIMVDSIEKCYISLGLIHGLYHPVNDKFKDYICNPKTNMYRSLHSTLFSPENKLVQAQIRTFDMDRIASFGLTAYWDINKGEARDVMQSSLREKFQFYASLADIDSMFSDNEEFVSQVKREIFGGKIYVYTAKGDVIELPAGSTPIDFAYKIHTELGNTIIGSIINDEPASIDTVLQSKDRVRILTDAASEGPKLEWLRKVKTTRARKKINEYLRR